MEAFEKYIKAITSYGGDEEQDYAPYFTEENEKAFDLWLKEQPKANGITLYRGYKFDDRYFEDCNLNEGEVVTPWSLTAWYHPAFTTDELRAVRYINDFGNAFDDDYVKILFKLHTKGKYMVDVSSLSVYPEESEYHPCQDARFRIVSTGRKGGYTTIVMEEI